VCLSRPITSRLGATLPNAHLHASIHAIVENQLAQEVVLMKDSLDRLRAEGLDRHEAIHAIGSVHTPYFQALQGLTASRWREEFGTTRKRIPHGSKLPVTLTMRERDLIRDETFCDPDFARCAVAEGTGIRVELLFLDTYDDQSE